MATLDWVPACNDCDAQMADNGRKSDTNVSTWLPSSGMELTHCRIEKIAAVRQQENEVVERSSSTYLV